MNGAPPGWSKSFKTGTLDWVRNNGDYLGGGAHGGTYNAMLYYASTSNHETYLITPAINFPAGTQSATLEFWHKQAFWSGDQDTLTVYYKIAPAEAGRSWRVIRRMFSSGPNEQFRCQIPAAIIILVFWAMPNTVMVFVSMT